MREVADLACRLTQVAAGWSVVAHRGNGLWRCTLPAATPELAWSALDLPVSADCADTPDPLLDRASHLLQQYFAGEPTRFDLPLDLEGLRPFTRTVLLACSQIPYGHLITYGELATLAGSPRAARAVGQVMATNPLPPFVPCHRVVARPDSSPASVAACP